MANQHSASDLTLMYKQVLNNDFIHQSNKNWYPILIGSTDPIETLKTGKNLGYKSIPDEFILNVNASNTQATDLLISAFTYHSLNVKGGKVQIH